MKKLIATTGKIVNRPRVMHYLDIFVAATATALYWDRDRLLGAHGLNALGCVAFGACVGGLKAVIEAYRKTVPATAPPPAK